MQNGLVVIVAYCHVLQNLLFFVPLIFGEEINGISMQPQGAAVHNFVIQLALSMVWYFFKRYTICLHSPCL